MSVPVQAVFAPSSLTPADARAAIARLRVPAYKVGAVASVNPSRLSKWLNERLYLPPDIVARIAAALETWPDGEGGRNG